MNEVRVHEFPFQMAVVAACIFVIAGTLVPGVPLEFLRFVALAVLAAQVWVERRATGSLFLTSPPFLLAAIPTVFFSVLPYNNK